MTRDLYIRPVGLTPLRPASDEEVEAPGLQLAGGWLTFMGLEVIERVGRDRRRTRVFEIGEYCERDWGRHGAAAAEALEALRQPRPRIAGLSLDRPRIMGIVNITPDSFSDGGRLTTAQAAIDHALRTRGGGGRYSRPRRRVRRARDQIRCQWRKNYADLCRFSKAWPAGHVR